MDDKAASPVVGSLAPSFGLPPSSVCFAIEQILTEWKKVEEEKRQWIQEKGEIMNKFKVIKEENMILQREKEELKKKNMILQYGIRLERTKAVAVMRGGRSRAPLSAVRPRRCRSAPVRTPRGYSADAEITAAYMKAMGKEIQIPMTNLKLAKKREAASQNIAPAKAAAPKAAPQTAANPAPAPAPAPAAAAAAAAPSSSSASQSNPSNSQKPMIQRTQSILTTPDQFVTVSGSASPLTKARNSLMASNEEADEDLKSKPLPSIANINSIFTPPPELAEKSTESRGSINPSRPFTPSISTSASTVPPSYFTTGTLNSSTKAWKSKFALRHHLDSVRFVSFDVTSPATAGTHSLILGSASEDNTAKLWDIGSSLQAAAEKKKITNVEPIYTFRGHRDGVTAVRIQSADNVVVTTSLDQTAMVWDYPPLNHELFGTMGTFTAYRRAELPHQSAVWDAALPRERGLVFTACADGQVYLWNLHNLSAPQALISNNLPNAAALKRSPASLSLPATDNGKLLVGYTSGEIGLLDIETCTFISSFTDPANDPAHSVNSLTNSSQRLTCVASHPTQSLCLTSHLDNSFRLWDFQSKQLVHLFCAHQDAVTSVSFNQGGALIASASHDSSIRIWDFQTRKIIQALDDSQTHRAKFREATHSVAFHPAINVLASAGADSCVKIYSN